MQPTPPAAPAPPPPPSVATDAVYEQVAQARQAAVDAQAAAGQAAATTGTRTLPRTAQDVANLRRQRQELSRQLENVQARRKDVAQALERAHDPVNQNGLQQRLRVLDQRIATLESDMAETGRLLASAPPSVLGAGSTLVPSAPLGDRGPPKTAVAIVFILFVLFPMVLMIGRGFLRRSARGVVVPDPAQRESAERLARVEQALEAIAIEVERVSEGQRFVTRLLAESRDRQSTPAQARGDDTQDAVPRYAQQH